MKKGKNPIDVHVGKRVQTIRVSRDLSEKEIADRLGLSVAVYGESEQGDRRFEACELRELSDALRVNVAFFFGALGALKKSISRYALVIHEQGDGDSELTAEVIPMFRQSAGARTPNRARRRP